MKEINKKEINEKEKYKEHYIDAFERKWKECLEKAKKEETEDEGEYATYLFDEEASMEEVVGFYIKFHKDNAFNEWSKAIDGLTLREKEKEISRILKDICNG